MRFQVAMRSHVGLVRSNNEDAATAGPRFIAVSDGVGGRAAGEVAATTTTTVVEALVARGTPLADAVQVASDVVGRLAAGNSLFTGMCATFTAVALEDGVPVLAHVGDSKAWLVPRSGTIQRLTEDHTVAMKLVRDGEIALADVATHPKRATLYQVVGSAKPLEVAGGPLAVAAGDRLVLATDGLDYAPGDVIAEVAAGEPSLDDFADALVTAALSGGGHDNVTVVVAEVVSDLP